VSNAGTDQTIEGQGLLTVISLDGTGSEDSDGDLLNYEWREGGVLLGTEATLQVSLGLGSHTITLTVTDPSGASSEDTLILTIVDTTPPALMLPPNITAEATGPAGAVVTFSASANDVVDGTVRISCTPPSSSTFPLGTTTVT
jgi:hypothetical protein